MQRNDNRAYNEMGSWDEYGKRPNPSVNRTLLINDYSDEPIIGYGGRRNAGSNGLQSKYNRMMDAQGGSSMNNNFYGYREMPQNARYGQYGAKGEAVMPGAEYRPSVSENVQAYKEFYPAYNNKGNANRLNKDNSQPVRRVETPMNAEANAQAQRGATQAELQRLAKTNPSLFRQIAKVMAENPLEGNKLLSSALGTAAIPLTMAMTGNDPLMNYVGGAGMLAATGANALMDVSMVAQPFVDAYGYVQTPEYIEERIRQMKEGLD